MTDELLPDDIRSLHERMERKLAADVDVDATWARVRERMAASTVVPLHGPRRSRRVVILAIAAALVVSGSAIATVRERIGEAGHPNPSGAHAPSLPPTTDREHEPTQGTTSNPTSSLGETADQGRDETSSDGHDGEQSESQSPDGDDGGSSGGQDGGDQGGSGDQDDLSGTSGDQAPVQDTDQVSEPSSDGASSDGGTDLSGDGSDQG